MDKFANLPSTEKAYYFDFAAERKNLTPIIVEKDFWVCWTLKQLFTIPLLKDELIFKGGTSLSKAFHLIERFYEDIDISINKSFFGFIDEKDPEAATSRKQQERLFNELTLSCGSFVTNDLKKILEGQFSTTLADIDEPWKIESDPEDKAGSTLLFHYPSPNSSAPNSYVRDVVKIELGCRGGREPACNQKIAPFVEEVITGAVSEPNISVITLAAERTFWEKATILHMYAHWPQGKQIPERQSRHFYDFYRLLQSDVFNTARLDRELLKKVANHKKLFFRAAWAKYDDAANGSLRLLPNDEVLDTLRADYIRMTDMFYGHPIGWSEIINRIKEYQSEF